MPFNKKVKPNYRVKARYDAKSQEEKEKRFSQNFIENRERVKEFLEKSNIKPGDLVVEIGPGRGVITNILLRHGCIVKAVEVDNELSEKLKGRFSDDPNFSLFNGDFKNFRLPEEPYKIFSNIPFSQTADILKKITNYKTAPSDAYIIVQVEAARRFAGLPYVRDSFTSVSLKPDFEFEIVGEFEKADFFPIPNVDIVMFYVKKKVDRLFDDQELKKYRKFIEAIFEGPGVNIKQKLLKIFTFPQIQRIAKELKFKYDDRPTDLRFSQYVRLWGTYKALSHKLNKK